MYYRGELECLLWGPFRKRIISEQDLIVSWTKNVFYMLLLLLFHMTRNVICHFTRLTQDYGNSIALSHCCDFFLLQICEAYLTLRPSFIIKKKDNPWILEIKWLKFLHLCHKIGQLAMQIDSWNLLESWENCTESMSPPCGDDKVLISPC